MTDEELHVLGAEVRVNRRMDGDGIKVRVDASDYSYEGWLDVVFPKRSGKIRCVVEDVNGRLFIHNAGAISLR